MTVPMWLGGGMSAGGWFDGVGPRERVKKLTAEANADRAAAQSGYEPVLSRFVKRLRRLLAGDRPGGGNGSE